MSTAAFVVLLGAWVASGWVHAVVTVSWRPYSVSLGIHHGLLLLGKSTLAPDEVSGPLEIWHQRVKAPEWLLLPFSRHYLSKGPVLTSFREFHLPLWPALGILGASSTWLWRFHWRRGFGEGRCPKCGYALAGLAPGAACPECGRPSATA